MDTLFDFAEQNNTPIEGSRKLDIVQMEFMGAKRMSWEELFEGFDDIKVITFSSGVQFVFRLLSKFKTGEIIFGCEDIISFKVQEIMAFQIKLIEKLQAQIPDRIIKQIRIKTQLGLTYLNKVQKTVKCPRTWTVDR